MSCHNLRRTGLTAAALAAALAITGTAAAQSMVVRSSGPSAKTYPIGKKLGATDKLVLAAGDKIVLMTKGTTRTLSGPGTFSASGTVQVSQTMGTTVTRMISKGTSGRSRGGFTREVGTAGMPLAATRAPNLWLLDYRYGGTFCVADPATLLVWRPDNSGDTLLKVETGEGTGAQVQTVAMLDGSNSRRWPTDVMPVAYGTPYRLTGSDAATPVAVTFTPVETLPETPEEMADLLLAKGCSVQLERLVDAMAEAEAATAG